MILAELNIYCILSNSVSANIYCILSNSVSATLSCGVLSKATELREYGLGCVQPGVQYIQDKFSTDFEESVEAFKAARLFVPKHVVELKPDADAIDCFTALPLPQK